MLPIRDENAHQTLFFSNIFNTCADDNFTQRYSTRCEHDDAQRRSADVKWGGLYIEIHV